MALAIVTNIEYLDIK